MRIKLAVVAGAAAVLTAGTGAAAYAVVGHSNVSPTVAGNDLPIDDNHSAVPTPPSVAPATATHVEPGDDRGAGVEPGDDRGRGRGSGGADDGGGHR